MQNAFIYSDKYIGYSYGPTHPMKLERLKLTFDLINAYGLLDLPSAVLVEAKEASEDDILVFHTPEYIKALKRANEGKEFLGAWHYKLGHSDNPIVKGLYDLSLLSAGASLQAARLVEGGNVSAAFNIAGGLHHAMSGRASGFCYLNDIVVAINHLTSQGKKIAYIDIDAHHGDGVQSAFYDTDRVLTISIHESGRYLFPGTGFEHEIGIRAGKGYAVNVPLAPYSDDYVFRLTFDEVVPPLIEAYKPDIIVSQLGVDTFATDPLTHLNLTTNGYVSVVSEIKTMAPKWIALGGGGYDLSNVARGWTLAWAIMNEVELPDELPAKYLKEAARFGINDEKLRDEPYEEPDRDWLVKEAKRVVESLKQIVFPIVGA